MPESTNNTSKVYLTKSRFQIGMQCPTKLYYHLNHKEYANQKLDDTFLAALAKGGFQVGALAQAYYPEGILVKEESNQAAIQKTRELLEQDNCTLFEAAIEAGPFLIRIDILKKTGKRFELIEVKAKSFHPEDGDFYAARGGIKSNWKPYLYDVSFQQMVLQKAYPDSPINCFLMLADKSKVATVDGLNQKFRIIEEKGRFKVETTAIGSVAELGQKILIRIPVDDEVAILQNEEFKLGGVSYTPETFALQLVEDMADNNRRYIGIGKQCNSCEYQTVDVLYKSGFHECWRDQAGLNEEQLRKPLLFELWKGLIGPKDITTPLFDRGHYFLENFQEEDYMPKVLKEADGFSPTERRTLQISKTAAADTSPCYHEDYLREQFAGFVYPLHFIDFETTALAIPMYAGRKPYEQVAFQFSHHQVEADGSISHKTQWLNDQVGDFPNYDFVRALKKALENDQGTIFRYHNHENSILNAILKQLAVSSEPDKEELTEFICSITHEKDIRTGDRDMCDLYQLVIKGFYHTSMKGSNSIKAVLPAIIECSPYLQEKYFKPSYGTNEIPSLNLKDHTWLVRSEDGKIKNPYKTLPPIFNGIDNDLLDEICKDEDEELADGGAAMMAYAKMQFSEMSEKEREFYRNALLKYCELDTLAMVMIYEGWREYLQRENSSLPMSTLL